MPTENIKVLVDFGSTFTKVVVVDLDKEDIVSRAQSPSTVREDATIGLKESLRKAGVSTNNPAGCEELACSSASGGLRMVCTGFVPELTSKAARYAALGAGAKVVACYSYKLTQREVLEIEQLSPDIILVTGGTDGGNTEVITHNARMIAESERLTANILVAGNKVSYDKIEEIFKISGKLVKFTKNVMPDIGVLELRQCNEEIRELFIKHIVKAKGITEDVLMPTPMAVLRAAALLSQGFDGEKGLGDIIVTDVGGATTDVVSIGRGNPSRPNVVLRGLPEPYAKRTVEGDLGVRYNLDTLVEFGRKKGMFLNQDLDKIIRRFAEIQKLPQNGDEFACDAELAHLALEIATERHVGRTEVIYGPSGELLIQYGKDLSNVDCVVGTGGPIVFSSDPRKILEGAIFDENRSDILKPKSPRYYVDESYILYAAGLLAASNPKEAFHLMKKHLKEV